MLDSTGKDDRYKDGRHLANSAKKTDPLGVSIPAIGEAFHGLSENMDHDDEVCRDAATTLRGLVKKQKLVLVGVGGEKDVYSIANELIASDYRLDPVDALILAVACRCDSCHLFHTTDGVMVKSISIAIVTKKYGVKIRPP